MKKGVVIGCGLAALLGLVCVGVIGFGGYFAFGLYKDTTAAADAFLAKLGAGDVPGAYASAGGALRQQQTEAEFKAAVEKLKLTEYTGSSWTGFNIVNDQATIDGTVTTKSGSLPLKVKLVKESDGWKVIEVTSTSAGVGGDEKKPADGPGTKTKPTGGE